MFGKTATNLQRNVFATHDHVFADSNQPTNINQSATDELFAHAATNHQRLIFASRIPPTDRGLSSNDNLCPQAANNRPTTTRFRNQPTNQPIPTGVGKQRPTPSGLEDHCAEEMLFDCEHQIGRASVPQLRRPTPRMRSHDLSLRGHFVQHHMVCSRNGRRVMLPHAVLLPSTITTTLGS